MKKYFFLALALILAFGFSSFTTVKNTKPISTDNISCLTTVPTKPNIENVSITNGIYYYTNWELVESWSCDPEGCQKACKLGVDIKYVKEVSEGNYRLLAQNIIEEGKQAFPMVAVPGCSGPYYIVVL
jgi:hypothetical protein